LAPGLTFFPYTTLFRSRSVRRRLKPCPRKAIVWSGKQSSTFLSFKNLKLRKVLDCFPHLSKLQKFVINLKKNYRAVYIYYEIGIDRKSTRLNSSHVSIS